MSTKDLREMTDRELYDYIMAAQGVLIDKRAGYKTKLEEKEQFDVEYAAVTNEVNSLKKGLNALKLFSEKIQ
jgi:hypothetical protein